MLLALYPQWLASWRDSGWLEVHGVLHGWEMVWYLEPPNTDTRANETEGAFERNRSLSGKSFLLLTKIFRRVLDVCTDCRVWSRNAEKTFGHGLQGYSSSGKLVNRTIINSHGLRLMQGHIRVSWGFRGSSRIPQVPVHSSRCVKLRATPNWAQLYAGMTENVFQCFSFDFIIVLSRRCTCLGTALISCCSLLFSLLALVLCLFSLHLLTSWPAPAGVSWRRRMTHWSSCILGMWCPTCNCSLKWKHNIAQVARRSGHRQKRLDAIARQLSSMSKEELEDPAQVVEVGSSLSWSPQEWMQFVHLHRLSLIALPL